MRNSNWGYYFYSWDVLVIHLEGCCQYYFDVVYGVNNDSKHFLVYVSCIFLLNEGLEIVNEMFMYLI